MVGWICPQAVADCSIEETNRSFMYPFSADGHLGMNIVCGSHTGCYSGLVCNPTPACSLLSLPVLWTVASGIIPSTTSGANPNQMWEGRVLEEGGCARESDSFHPCSLQSAPGASSWPRMWAGRTRGPRDILPKTGNPTGRSLKERYMSAAWNLCPRFGSLCPLEG